MSVHKYYLSDGKTRWYVQIYYVDWMGKRRRIFKRGFETQRAAKEFERSFERKNSRSTEMTFGELYEEYKKDMLQRLKPTTMETKQWIIEDKILPYFADLTLENISSYTIRQWQNAIIARKDKDGNPYKPTYLKTINNQLSAMLNYAVAHFGMKRNPCHEAGTMGKGKAGKMAIWTKEQYDTFISHEAKSAHRLAFDILFYGGLRLGELIALTPADIGTNRKISIRKNFARINGEDIIVDPKTQKSGRDVVIPDKVYDEFRQYLADNPYLGADERLFYFSADSLRKEMKRVIRLSGVPDIRLHDLRHSHASMLINLGVKPIEIADRLGHESVKTTLDVYGHLYPDADVNMADLLNGI